MEKMALLENRWSSSVLFHHQQRIRVTVVATSLAKYAENYLLKNSVCKDMFQANMIILIVDCHANVKLW